MDISIFSPTPSHPTNSGNRQAIYRLGKYLQQSGYVVHFAYYSQEGLSKDQYDAMQDTWDYFDAIIATPPPMAPKGAYFLKDDWYDPRVGDYLSWKVQAFGVQIILFHYIFQSRALEGLPSFVRKIIHTHDRMSNRHLLFDVHGLDREFFWTSVDEERNALQRADEIVAVQEGEAQFFRQLTGRPVYVLRQLFEEAFLPLPDDRSLITLGYFGSRNRLNVDGIRDFARRFSAYQQCSSIPLRLAIGGGVTEMLQDLMGVSCIDLLGTFEHPRDFYSKVDLIINPMKIGTGLKIKTVEALSYGLPIISTRAGFAGITSTRPEHNCETVEEMVRAVDVVASNPNGLKDLTNASVEVFRRYQEETALEVSALFPVMGRISVSKSQFAILQPCEFMGSGFYPVENDADGNQFRWTGPKTEAEIVIDVDRDVSVECRLVVKNAITARVFRSILVEVDDRAISARLHAVDHLAGELQFVIPANTSFRSGGRTCVRLRWAESSMPLCLDVSSLDSRYLGLCLGEMVLRVCQESV